MNLDEIVKGRSARNVALSAALVPLEGDIEPDIDEQRFRLYPAKSHRKNVFYVIPRSAVGEIYQWTPEELATNGITGQSRYRVLVNHGTVVQLVSVTHHRVGEGRKAVAKVAKKSSQDCECVGPDDGCPASFPCVDDCDNCGNCCIG